MAELDDGAVGVAYVQRGAVAASAEAGRGSVDDRELTRRCDGVEVGRIVESAPHGVEVDLLALLNGTATGVLSLRTDL